MSDTKSKIDSGRNSQSEQRNRTKGTNDWLRFEWREFYKPITHQSETKPTHSTTTVDTQLKIALPRKQGTRIPVTPIKADHWRSTAACKTSCRNLFGCPQALVFGFSLYGPFTGYSRLLHHGQTLMIKLLKPIHGDILM